MAESMKVNKYVEKAELATFLRDLADSLESEGKDEFACVESFKKIKIGVKNEFGQISLKVRIKAEEPCAPDEQVTDENGAPVKPKYKSLKKRMRSSFNMLLKMVHDGQMPPAEAVESFLADSALMVTYPGYGDEYYDDYTKACEDLRAAYEAQDMEKLHAAVDVLIHEKSRCHAKYD